MAGLWTGYFVGGIATTVICLGAGMSRWTVVLAAVVMYSSSSTLAAIGLLATGAPTSSALATGYLVSSRFGVMAAAISPRLERSVARRAVAAFLTLDPSVAVAMRESDDEATRQVWWRIAPMLYGCWIVGTLAGFPLHRLLQNPKQWGLDAVLPASLLPLLAGGLRGRDGLVTAALAAIICAVAIPTVAAGLPVLLALLAVGAGLAVGRRRVSAR